MVAISIFLKENMSFMTIGLWLQISLPVKWIKEEKQQQILKSRAFFCQNKAEEKTMNLPLKEKPNLL